MATLLVPGSAYRQVLDASRRMTDAGWALRELLAGREVRHVWWLNEGASPTGFLMLRDPSVAPLGGGRYASGADPWTFLAGRWAETTPLTDGTATDLASRLDAYTDDGDVVVVMGRDYRLRLVAFEGEPLLDASPAP